MFCVKCGNDSDFRVNQTARTVVCRNTACNNLLRTKVNFAFVGVDASQWFAAQMLLRLNRPFPTARWTHLPVGPLLLQLRAKVKQLEDEIIRQANDKVSDTQEILTECCDVANLAMMISDITCITKSAI